MPAQLAPGTSQCFKHKCQCYYYRQNQCFSSRTSVKTIVICGSTSVVISSSNGASSVSNRAISFTGVSCVTLVTRVRLTRFTCSATKVSSITIVVSSEKKSFCYWFCVFFGIFCWFFGSLTDSLTV